VEQALAEASGVLPFLTAFHSPSASVFGYWPEKDMGGLLDAYLQVDGSDAGLFASAQDAAAAGLRGTPDARRRPSEVAGDLERLATRATSALDAACAAARTAGQPAERELRGLSLDVRVNALLARYHAAKARAAEHLAWFYASGDLASLHAAKPAAAAALAVWEELVGLTGGVYHHDLVFGRASDQDGHWQDNLPYAQHDVARLEEVEAVLREYGLFDLGFDFGQQLPPRTGIPPIPYLHDYSVERRFAGVGPQSLYDPARGWGWGITSGLLATEAPKCDGKTLRASGPRPATLPREPLYCDFVSRHAAAPYDNGTFLVDLPNGDYDVVVILADRSAAPRDHGPMTAILQARHRLGPVAVPAGAVVNLRQRVTVSNGRLTLELTARPQDDWLLTGLTITSAAPRIGHRPPVCARPGESLVLTATISSVAPLATAALHYRMSESAPFTVQRVDLPAAGDGERPALAEVPFRIDVPVGAEILDYYFEAVDTRGAAACWPPAGGAAPRRLHVGAASDGPAVVHRPVTEAAPDQPLAIAARVTSGAPVARATLHYRNVNQMHTHDRLEMVPVDPMAHSRGAGEVEYAATIPAEHVTSEWDLMYHIEVVDVLGNAVFHPGLAAATPYVVVTVRRP
jgi:hypothetical protein